MIQVTYLTTDELALYAPVTVNDYSSTKFDAYTNIAVREVIRSLPYTMHQAIREQAFTDKPELYAFWEVYLKPWVAWVVYVKMVEQGSLIVTPDGTRTITDNFSAQAGAELIASSLTSIKKDANRFKQDALADYINRKYVFDNIAYPPSANMEGNYLPVYANLNYVNCNGVWGWQDLQGNFLGFGYTDSNQSSTFTIHIF